MTTEHLLIYKTLCSLLTKYSCVNAVVLQKLIVYE